MKKKICIAVITLLFISNIYFLSQWQSAKSDRLYYDYAIPHVELIAAMAFYDFDVYGGKVITHSNPGAIATGRITGFVVFPNKNDQPKGAQQYYTIEATDQYDETGKQIFSLTETLKLNAIPPSSFEKELLRVTSNTGQSVTLQSESGQTFQIDKRTDKVSVIDQDGSITTLLTNQSDYKDFTLDFLK
jgi:hypothetical protein